MYNSTVINRAPVTLRKKLSSPLKVGSKREKLKSFEGLPQLRSPMADKLTSAIKHQQ